jgi:hypothetical protein
VTQDSATQEAYDSYENAGSTFLLTIRFNNVPRSYSKGHQQRVRRNNFLLQLMTPDSDTWSAEKSTGAGGDCLSSVVELKTHFSKKLFNVHLMCGCY